MKAKGVMKMKRMAMGLVCLLLAVQLCGCGALETLMHLRETAVRDKPVYTLEEGGLAHLSGPDGAWAVLNETAPEERRGAWTGRVERWVLVDETGGFTASTALGDYEVLRALAQEDPLTLIPYGGVYADTARQNGLLVEIAGALHPLVPEADAAGRALYAPRPESGEMPDWALGQDCRVLVHGAQRYRVTQEAVTDETGDYLGLLAQSVVFERDTGRKIPREELAAVEITPGPLSAQQRVARTYGAVYSLPGTGDVAVEVNDEILRAVLENS